MDNLHSVSAVEKSPEENIVELIRKLRNDLIKDFLDERHLKIYFADKYNIRELTAVKVEFIKKELKEMLIAPVNVDHYAALIQQIRDSDSASLSEGNDELFYRDLASIFRKYAY